MELSIVVVSTQGTILTYILTRLLLNTHLLVITFKMGIWLEMYPTTSIGS